MELPNASLVGTTFMVEDANGNEKVYEIVLPADENKLKGKMSCSGPYGKAFCDKKVGDSARIGLGGAIKEVVILEIEKVLENHN